MDANLILLKKNGERRAFRLNKGINVIGRRPDCDLRIPLMEISRRHCQLDCREGLFTLRDLRSSNGTFVNSQRIEEVKLQPGDIIQIGPLTFVLEVGVPAESQAPQAAAGQQPAAPAQVSDDDLFDDIGHIEDSKSGSATEFPTES
jgi:pSer/pThr/pTyr-binding forkhead associated (FHA) protein